MEDLIIECALNEQVDRSENPKVPIRVGKIVSDARAGKCKDEDGDGFRPPEDCDETDASINPAACGKINRKWPCPVLSNS